MHLDTVDLAPMMVSTLSDRMTEPSPSPPPPFSDGGMTVPLCAQSTRDGGRTWSETAHTAVRMPPSCTMASGGLVRVSTVLQQRHHYLDEAGIF